MFERIYSYPSITEPSGRVVRPRAYGRVEADATWSGWLVFFSGDTAVGVLHATTQASAEAVAAWMVGISPEQLGAALTLALSAESAPLLGRELRELERIERDAADEVESMERDASIAAELAADHQPRAYAVLMAAGHGGRREHTVMAPSAATAGATGTISITFGGLAPAIRYLGSIAYEGAPGLPNPTIVRIDTP